MDAVGIGTEALDDARPAELGIRQYDARRASEARQHELVPPRERATLPLRMVDGSDVVNRRDECAAGRR